MLASDKWPKELKKTKARILIWDLLHTVSRPYSAQEIEDALKQQETPVWISTIYRVLEDLEKYHLLEKTELPDKNTTLYEIINSTHKHYAVCLGCHTMIPLDDCPFEIFQPKVSEEDFEVIGHRIQVHGYCKQCK